MLFEPVWISSTEHLATFERIYDETSWLRRASGAYSLPAGFPYIRMASGLFGTRPVMPIVMFSQGQMRVENQTAYFHAMDWSTPPKARFTRFNLRTDWDFALKAEDVISIQPFPYKSPIMRYYDMPFIRINTRHSENELRDFLVCVGGIGPSMSNIHKQSEELAAALQTLSRQ